jgi:hypothetical protein
MFQPASLQALARSLQILSDPRALLTYSFYVRAARRASAIDAAHTVSCRRLCCRHECGGGPSLFWNWGLSGRCADCRESAAATLSRLAYRWRPTQQPQQLGEVHRHLPRLVARQPIWSPSGATQRYVRNRGRNEVRGLRLKRR